MFKPRINTKLLRHVGVILIALPEPITTPFGVAFVLISRYLARRHEAILNKRLGETLKYYLAHFKRFRDGESGVPAGVRHYARLITQYQDNHSFEANPRSWRDTGGIVHHSINMESLLRRYGMKDGPKAGPGGSRWEVTSGGTKKPTSHSLAMHSSPHHYYADDSSRVKSDWSRNPGTMHRAVQHSMPQHYDTNAVRPVKVTYHCINMASLRRRYGLVASPAVSQRPLR